MAAAYVEHNNTSQCDNCRKTGVLKDAVSFCSQCDLHFCVACDTLHGKYEPGHKTDRNESVDTAGDKVDERLAYATCSKHRKETAEYYCEAHKFLICKACSLSEHANCAVQNLSDACEEIDISKDMCDLTEQLRKLQEATDRLKREKQLTLNTYQSDINDQRYNIKSLWRKFNNMFDRYDAQLESQEASTVNNLSSSIRSYTRLSDQVKEQIESLEEKYEGPNKQLLFQLLVNAKNKCTEFSNALETIRSKKTRREMFIKKSKSHQTLVDQLSKLVHQGAESKEVDSEDEALVNKEKEKKKSFLNVKLCSTAKETEVRLHNENHAPYISGCCWLPDCQAFLCDYNNNNIKILDKDFNVTFTAPSPPYPWDVDSIDDSTVVVTLPSAKALQFISVKPGFKFQQKRDLNLCCMGVCVYDKNIFVCIEESEPSKRGVKVLNLNGDDVSFISHLGSGQPRYVTPNVDGTMIYYTGGSGNGNFVNCVTKDGYGIFSISSPKLSCPRSIVKDECNNIMICDDEKKCVQIISAGGVCGNILLTENNNMYAPKSMCLNKTYDNLIVASYKYVLSGTSLSKLTVYKLEYS